VGHSLFQKLEETGIMRIKLPSVQNLSRLTKKWFEDYSPTIDHQQAKDIRLILDYNCTFKDDIKEGCDRIAYAALLDVIKKFPDMSAFTYDEPNCIQYVRSNKDSIYIAYGFYYIMVGDTYRTTLIWDCAQQRFVVSSWGDWLEVQERNGRKFS
jgi:hypothetical protein